MSLSAQDRVIYGLKAGISKPPINGGFVWDFEDDAIDSDLGFITGIDVLIPIGDFNNFNTGLYFSRETYHIHFYAPQSLTYHFYYSYITLPISIQYKFATFKKLNLFVSTGLKINYGNLTNKKNYVVSNNQEVTNILEQEWALEPQFFGGLGAIANSRNFGSVQLQLTYNTSFFRHLNYKGILRVEQELFIEERKSRHVIPVLSLTYFPKLKVRKPSVKWSRCK